METQLIRKQRREGQRRNVQIGREPNRREPNRRETNKKEQYRRETCSTKRSSGRKSVRRRRYKRSRCMALLLLICAILMGLFSCGFGGAQKEIQVEGSSMAADATVYNQNEDIPWNLTLVNRWNPIPEDYSVNLVEVAGGEAVDERIYEPLMAMLEAAKESNWGNLPMVVSGYRTAEKQQSLYDEKIAKYRVKGYSEQAAKEQAEQWVALPGTSEHQLGFAVDINGDTYDVYLWLQAHSYQYGFVFRYPGSKTEITGVAEEVWHYRYVGVEAATEMYEQGLCLEEYLERNDTTAAGR